VASTMAGSLGLTRGVGEEGNTAQRSKEIKAAKDANQRIGTSITTEARTGARLSKKSKGMDLPGGPWGAKQKKRKNTGGGGMPVLSAQTRGGQLGVGGQKKKVRKNTKGLDKLE